MSGFRLVETSWKSRDLVYEDSGRRLVVYLEMSGVSQFDWVGSDTELALWTEPPNEPIGEDERNEILRRLASWSLREGLRIGLGPPVDLSGGR